MVYQLPTHKSGEWYQTPQNRLSYTWNVMIKYPKQRMGSVKKELAEDLLEFGCRLAKDGKGFVFEFDSEEQVSFFLLKYK